MTKQGQASSSGAGAQKREPQAKAVSVDAVADIGLKKVHYNQEPLYKGRGYEAPMSGSTIHHSGSQGKHR